MSDKTDKAPKRILCFGDELEVIDLRNDVAADEVVVVYRNLSRPETKPKVAALSDWLEWDRNSRAAIAARRAKGMSYERNWPNKRKRNG